MLTYHRVSPQRDGIFDPTPPEVFQRQVAHLAKYYNVLSAGDASLLAREGRLPERAAVITLDDGYADNHTYALPILKKYNVPATVFVATGPVDGTGILWHDRLFVAFARTRCSLLETGEGGRYSLMSPDDRWRVCQLLAQRLRSLGEVAREELLSDLCQRLGVDPAEALSRSPMLTWDHVREMAASGIEIGGHTVTHPILSRLSENRQREEIIRGLERIEEETGTFPKVFAYPNGRLEDFDETTVLLLRSAGISAAYTTVFGGNDGARDPLRLCRGAAWTTHPARFALQMLWYRAGLG